jgi:hypothetical protein
MKKYGLVHKKSPGHLRFHIATIVGSDPVSSSKRTNLQPSREIEKQSSLRNVRSYLYRTIKYSTLTKDGNIFGRTVSLSGKFFERSYAFLTNRNDQPYMPTRAVANKKPNREHSGRNVSSLHDKNTEMKTESQYFGSLFHNKYSNREKPCQKKASTYHIAANLSLTSLITSSHTPGFFCQKRDMLGYQGVVFSPIPFLSIRQRQSGV